MSSRQKNKYPRSDPKKGRFMTLGLQTAETGGSGSNSGEHRLQAVQAMQRTLGQENTVSNNILLSSAQLFNC